MFTIKYIETNNKNNRMKLQKNKTKTNNKTKQKNKTKHQLYI